MSQTIGNRAVGARGSSGVTGIAPVLVIVAAVVQAATGVATSTIAPSFADRTTIVFGYAGAWLTVTHVMVLAGIVGLYATRAARSGWLKRVGFAVALVGFAAQVLGESVLRVNFDLGNAFFGIATPATGLGMILVGIAVITSRRWTGWHRYAPLVCGLYVPVVLVPAFVAAKGPSFIALGGWAFCFLALGIAMRAQQRA